MKILSLLLILISSIPLAAQKPVQPDAAEILHDIQKLKVLGSVLYVAAHPDDENTRLISWLANEKKVQTAYLSMTRGDGGQNLIGPEIREELGIIRTQELLAARRIDNGLQYFTRANDFGYSKSPEETFNLWDEEKILGDVVWVIRKFRPDVIITRFPQTGEGGHGHHTASAILANKAFSLAGDPKAYPEQLKHVEPWQPKRVYVNTGRWWNPDMTGEEPGVITVDVGGYNSLLGTSYTEMAALSRSQHKSQGFGVTGSRGEALEFLEHTKGDTANSDMFEGINTSWERIGEPEIEEQVNGILRSYNPLNPSGSIESLLELRKNISAIKNKHWREVKLREIDKIIKGTLGLFMEAVAADPYVVRSENVNITLELINRSEVPVTIKRITWPDGAALDSSFVQQNNKDVKLSHAFVPGEETPLSAPYWLKEKAALGYYNVSDQQMIGKGENGPAFQVEIGLSLKGTDLSYTIPVVYKWNDPVAGEQYRPVAVVPPVSVSFSENIYIFPDQQPKQVNLKVKSFTKAFSGTVTLDLPSDWEVSPIENTIKLQNKLAEDVVSFMVTPPKGQSSLQARVKIKNGAEVITREVSEISYEHFPVQTLVSTAEAEFVKLDVQINGNRIGYIEGAGDAIPATLRELGYTVNVLNENLIKQGLSHYDAIIVGIRALNANERIGFMMEDLLNYVKNGGVLIFQYNTSFSLNTQNFSPYPLTLGRDRVTVEEAPVKILNPNHPVLNYPNKITAADFDNWVQERGLYFPGKWDDRFEPILGIGDPGEPETMGSLLIAPYGEGHYVYSGLSWFRQLPAGVPGAIRIFANLLSLGSNSENSK